MFLFFHYIKKTIFELLQRVSCTYFKSFEFPQRETFDDFPEIPNSDVSFPDPEEKTPQVENATLSYQDLRIRNRNGIDSGVLPQQQQPIIPAKKYNKYGDEIVD